MAWRKNRRIRVTRYFAHFTNGIAQLRGVAENRLFGEQTIRPFLHNMGTIIDRPVSEVRRRPVGHSNRFYLIIL